MEIKKTISLNVIRKGDEIVCDNLDTACLVVGTKALSSNLAYYGAKKVRNKFLISVRRIHERIRYLQEKVDKINTNLEIMRQVVK